MGFIVRVILCVAGVALIRCGADAPSFIDMTLVAIGVFVIGQCQRDSEKERP